MRAGLPALLLVFTSLILLAGGAFATPTGWGDETVLIDDANYRVTRYDIVRDAQDNIHVVWEGVNGPAGQSKVFYSKFDKNLNVLVNKLFLGNQLYGYSANDVELSVDALGNAHAYWNDVNITSLNTRIMNAKISAAGNVVQSGISVSSQSYFLRQLSSDVDTQNNIYLAWERVSSNGSGGRIFYLKLDNDENPLIPVTQLTFNQDAYGYPSVQVDSSDNIHFVFWYLLSATDPRTSIQYMKLDNYGNTIIPIKTIVPVVGGPGTNNKPSIAVGANNNIHLEWQSDAFTFGAAYLVMNSDGNIILPGTGLGSNQFYASEPSVDLKGNTYAPTSYQSFSTGLVRFYLTKFDTINQPQSNVVLVDANAFAVDLVQPRIIIDSKNIAHATWIEYRANQQRLKHKKQTPLPVLLVHGIYSDDSLWDEGGPGSIENKVWQAGYTPFRVGEVLNQPGLYPNNTNFWFLRNQVKQAIQNIKQQTGAEKVDVVAHSMGGLVTRAYISSNDYAGDINNLIMLGTPNEGAPIAASPFSILVGFTQGDILLDLGRYSMIPYSPSLLLLNLFYDEKGVNHITIGGKKFTDSLAKGLAICLAEPKYCSPFNLTTDSIVPLYSANFTGTCVEAPVTHASILGDSLTMNAVVRDDVIRALKGQNLTLPPCSEAGGGVLENNIELSSYNGSISTGQYQTIYSSLYVGKPFSAFLSWDSNQDLRLEFTNPLGQTVHSGNYGSFPGTTYQREILPGGSGVRFSFAQPLVGNWSVHVRGGALSGNQNYTANLFLQKPVNVSVSVDQSKYAPNQSVIISTDLIDVNIPVLNATVSADVNSPSGVITNVVLYDDGNHSDGSANDGTYANSFASTSQEGTYIFDVSAAGTSGGHPFTIHSKNAFYVALEPDLQLDHVPLVVMPSVPLAGQRAFVQVDVNNIGNAQATHASIEFWDGEPANGGVKFYQKSVNVPAGQSVQIKTRWIPTSGTHTIVVFPSSSNPFLDANYANEKVSKIVVVP